LESGKAPLLTGKGPGPIALPVFSNEKQEAGFTVSAFLLDKNQRNCPRVFREGKKVNSSSENRFF